MSDTCPLYEHIASDLKTKKSSIDGEYDKLMTIATQEGEELHRLINTIVDKRKAKLQESKDQHLELIGKEEEKFKDCICEIQKRILDLKRLMRSSDVFQLTKYTSENAYFRRMPAKVTVSAPSISPQKISIKQLNEQFGSLLPLSLITEEDGYTKQNNEEMYFLLKFIYTKCEKLQSVACLNDEKIWTCGEFDVLILYDLEGKKIKKVPTKSGHIPNDIAMTRKGHLVYVDYTDRTVNRVKNHNIKELIVLKEWRPLNVCCTFSDDLLVVMGSEGGEHAKVVRYVGNTEKQSIQFDGNGQPLYGPSNIKRTKYICENKNRDVCVADSALGAVVVVDKAGKIRFRYTGPTSSTGRSFEPVGITTDSQCRILTTDNCKQCIHIVDQDGQFLRNIDNCYFQNPRGLCVNTKDNLFVAESGGKVKKIGLVKDNCEM